MEDIEQLEQYYRKVYLNKVKLMSRLLREDHSYAEDVVQEAFTRACRFWPYFSSSKGELEKWFNTIMFNSLRDLQRDLGRGPKTSKLLEPDNDYILQESVFSLSKFDRDGPELTKLKHAISKVDNERHKQVLELFLLFGYSSTEIPQMIFGITRTNVTTIINRFRENQVK